MYFYWLQSLYSFGHFCTLSPPLLHWVLLLHSSLPQANLPLGSYYTGWEWDYSQCSLPNCTHPPGDLLFVLNLCTLLNMNTYFPAFALCFLLPVLKFCSPVYFYSPPVLYSFLPVHYCCLSLLPIVLYSPLNISLFYLFLDPLSTFLCYSLLSVLLSPSVSLLYYLLLVLYLLTRSMCYF